MASDPPLVCLITAGHVASTPRLVKNADALAEAGYRVQVIAGAPFPPADPLDEALLAAAKWRHARLSRIRGSRRAFGKAMRSWARLVVGAGPIATASIAARAHYGDTRRLAAAASLVPAGLFIGHGLAALHAASVAAATQGARYGFDIEDYHDAETEEALADPLERRARRRVQAALLPAARPLFCAAPLIARKYRESYGLDASVVLNVFPLSQAPASPRAFQPITEERPAVFYWFSQTIGPGRGLERALSVLGSMRTPAELHLRGFISADYRARLEADARTRGLRRPIRFLSPAPPPEMARLASAADVGLSIEETVPENRDICLSNKIFMYVLAGVPQLLSSTSAQRLMAAELGDAALPCDMEQPAVAAAALDGFLSDPTRVRRARDRAWELARGRFSWDHEKRVVLGAVGDLLPIKP